MPKLKIRKSVSRRFRITSRGKVLHKSSFSGHLKANKKRNQIRRYKGLKPIKTAVARKIKLLMGRSTK